MAGEPNSVHPTAAGDRGLVCVVAILKGEEPFVEEWLAYHRLLGVDHFFLYDNDRRAPLRALLRTYADFVTVVEWAGDYSALPGRNTQTKAYEDARRRIRHRWVAFIDGDEFIVLRRHAGLVDFLTEFEDAGAVLLTWYLFGHNGHTLNPDGMLTSALTRRRAAPGRMMKSICQAAAIESVYNAHRCRLRPGFAAVDANRRPFVNDAYPGKTEVAHINHYFCRSFENWMGRVDLGAVAFSTDDYPQTKDHLWRFDHDLAREKFLAMAAEMNEIADDYMLRYAAAIDAFLRQARAASPTTQSRRYGRAAGGTGSSISSA
ncbi:MAG: glycosyltransferase family 2 protein [bacterium]